MEKFSVYDFLGLLLPGALFVYFCNVMNSFFLILPFSIGNNSWEIKTVLLLCFALVAGAMLYSINFWLIKRRWYNWVFRMKKHVADLYLKLDIPFEAMNKSLNEKASQWFLKPIYFSPKELSLRDAKCLTNEEKQLQDDFYVRMYYELEYLEKIESAKTLQSFYYFFRQTVAACLLLLIIFVLLSIVWLGIDKTIFSQKTGYFVGIPVALLLLIALSAGHAQWYRKAMVLKIYWAYFTHLNQPLNK